jgi:hypothetical protein
MYVVGGLEKLGRVNYLHKFSYFPELYYSNYIDHSTLQNDISRMFEFRENQS